MAYANYNYTLFLAYVNIFFKKIPLAFLQGGDFKIALIVTIR